MNVNDRIEMTINDFLADLFGFNSQLPMPFTTFKVFTRTHKDDEKITIRFSVLTNPEKIKKVQAYKDLKESSNANTVFSVEEATGFYETTLDQYAAFEIEREVALSFH